MEKLTYLLYRDTDTPGPELRKALIDRAAPALRAAGAMQIGLSIADEDVAQGSGVAIIRSDPPIRALASFWMHSADERGPCEAVLSQHASELAGYLVVESRPILHIPPLGERAPGANLVTCIRRRADIDEARFIDLWNNEHRKVALETQSTFAYVRNAIVRKLSVDAPDFDGIVEEGFPIEALTDPHVWYDCDSDEEYQRRLRRMIDSVTAFLDLSCLESMPMSEYYIG